MCVINNQVLSIHYVFRNLYQTLWLLRKSDYLFVFSLKLHILKVKLDIFQ